MHLNNILLPLLFLNSQSWKSSSLFSLVVSYVSVDGQTDACKPFPFFLTLPSMESICPLLPLVVRAVSVCGQTDACKPFPSVYAFYC